MIKLNNREKKQNVGGFWTELIIIVTVINSIVGLTSGIANIVKNNEINAIAAETRSQEPQTPDYMVGNVKSIINVF